MAKAAVRAVMLPLNLSGTIKTRSATPHVVVWRQTEFNRRCALEKDVASAGDSVFDSAKHYAYSTWRPGAPHSPALASSRQKTCKSDEEGENRKIDQQKLI
jgi:hypothetical protein